MAMYSGLMRDFVPPSKEFNDRFQTGQLLLQKRQQDLDVSQKREQRQFDNQLKLARENRKFQLEQEKTLFDIKSKQFQAQEKAFQSRGFVSGGETATKEPPGAAMSLPGGDFGDVEGRQIGKFQPPHQQEQQAPFIADRINQKFIRNPLFTKPTTTTTDLSGEQEVKARALARRISGVRGAERILPAIAKLMKEGKNVDEVEDLIRFSGQSEQFTGAIRSAAQEVLINTSPSVAERTLDFIDDELSKGNITGVKSKLKRIARKTAGVEMSRSVMGKERTTEFLGEIQDDLNMLENSGINTNIFSGTLEEINKKIGRVREPGLRKVATKIAVAIQSYRRSMSGQAFSVPEAIEYKDIFPSIGRTGEFNTNTIDALRETMQGDLDNFYSLSMGEENYRGLFDNPVRQGQGQPQTFNTVQEAESSNLPIGTEIIIDGRRAVIE